MKLNYRTKQLPAIVIIFLILLSSPYNFFYTSALAETGTAIEFIGITSLEAGFRFKDTEVGGLSGITYDPDKALYYAISDDRSQKHPARFYTLSIDISDGSLDKGDVRLLNITSLQNKEHAIFQPGSIDPEGISLVSSGGLFISSEGDSSKKTLVNPFISCFKKNGEMEFSFKLPGKFLPDTIGKTGVRNNLAFESLTSSTDGKRLYTATENALAQDGPAADHEKPSLSRVLELDVEQKRAAREFVYPVSPAPYESNPPGGFITNGLVELLTINDKGLFLALERSFAVGVGFSAVLFKTSLENATDVSNLYSLPGNPFTPMKKKAVFDFRKDSCIIPDNIEGMTWGPALKDGRRLLILVSDNNFQPAQSTQFIALAVNLVKISD